MDQTVRLAVDVIAVVRHVRDVRDIQTPLTIALHFLRERSRELATSTKRGFAIRQLESLVAREDAPQDIVADGQKTLSAINALLSGPTRIGRVKRFTRTKGFGFLIDDSGEDLYFRWTAVPDVNAQILLVPGSVVEYMRGTADDGRPIAESVTPDASGADVTLRDRRARVIECKPTFCIAEDEATNVRVLIHHTAFERRSNFNAVEPGDLVRSSYELVPNGPRAIQSSARIVRSNSSGASAARPR